jgi:hypothetical protein
MATEPPTRPQSRFASAAAGHETKDASVAWIAGIVLFMALSGIVIHLVLSGMLTSLRYREPVTDRWKPAGRAAIRQEFAAARFPKLQVNPSVDLKSLRDREDEELKNYGWIDKSSGIVRIPIGRAMDLLLERGFPVLGSSNQVKPGPSSFELQQQRAAQGSPEVQNRK